MGLDIGNGRRGEGFVRGSCMWKVNRVDLTMGEEGMVGNAKHLGPMKISEAIHSVYLILTIMSTLQGRY